MKINKIRSPVVFETEILDVQINIIIVQPRGSDISPLRPKFSMEHNNVHKSFQGGVTGQVFRFTPQVVRYERTTFMDISRDAIYFPENNTPSDGGNGFQKHNFRKVQLRNRIFYLYKRKGEAVTTPQLPIQHDFGLVPQVSLEAPTNHKITTFPILTIHGTMA